MSEIDVSKCDYYFQGRCGVSKNINYSIGCHANNCYYKQLQQANKTIESQKGIIKKFVESEQQLKARLDSYEKDGGALDEGQAWANEAMASRDEISKLNNCLNEIEEIVKDFHLSMIIFHKGATHEMADRIDNYLDRIKQLIKQAKEGEE